MLAGETGKEYHIEAEKVSLLAECRYVDRITMKTRQLVDCWSVRGPTDGLNVAVEEVEMKRRGKSTRIDPKQVQSNHQTLRTQRWHSQKCVIGILHGFKGDMLYS